MTDGDGATGRIGRRSPPAARDGGARVSPAPEGAGRAADGHAPRARRRGPLKRLGRAAAPRAGRAAASLLWRTCRLSTGGTEALEALAREGRPFVACYWHAHQLFCVRALLAIRERHPALNLGYLISPSRDGDDAARLFADLELRVIRGSATRGGAAALREIFLAIRSEGVSPVITPDGPTGPARVFKPGVAMIASLAGVPLVPLAMAARPAATLGSWDRALVPLPFARVHVEAGEPIEVPRPLDDAASAALCDSAGAALEALGARATEALR